MLANIMFSCIIIDMRFINRNNELHRLNTLISKKQGGLAVLWGRRRVGKTRLLLEWSKKNNGLYTVADQSASSIQRSYLATSISTLFKGMDSVMYPDWKSLLNSISRASEQANWHGPLIFDEFPHLVIFDSSLPSIFQNWIDHEAKRAALTVVIAGSSQRMMQGLVLDSHAPLFGRSSEMLKIKPLLPGYMQKGCGLSSAHAVIESYSIWGGIPRYWELANEYKDNLDKAVDSCVLDPLSPLHEEPDLLLREEIPPAVSLRPLLDIIGAGAHRISEIAARLGKPATSLTRPLSHLIDLGIIRREIPFGELEKNTKRSLYKIIDPFFQFWFKVVAPHKSLLAEAPYSSRLSVFRKYKQTLISEIWEELCRKCIPHLQSVDSSLSKLGPWGLARRYWKGNGPEWDIVAESLDGKRLLLGEVKWYPGKTTEQKINKDYMALVRKGIPAIKNKDTYEIVYALFIPETIVDSKGVDTIHIVDAVTVVSCLKFTDTS
jgi:uncharacterized protein